MVKTGRSRNAAKAFTVIELLTVIGIIMVLAGILVPVLIGARANARLRIAKAMMKTICVALDRYYQDFGCYPPDSGHFGEFAADACQDGAGAKYEYTLYKHLCGDDGKGIVDPRTMLRHGPYMTFKDSQLLTDDSMPDYWRVAIDPWGKPWVYEEHMSHTLQRNYDQSLHLAHHHSRYDLYSVGPDQQLDPGSHNAVDDDGDGWIDEPDEAFYGGGSGDQGEHGDDITNWW